MRKWLVALIAIMVLCVAACCASAEEDPFLNITVSNSNTTINAENGGLDGSYYYKIHADTNLDSFWMGWSEDLSADEPDPNETYMSPISRWYADGENGYFIITIPPQDETKNADAMFWRIGDDDPWQKIVFNYDRSKTGTTAYGYPITTNDPMLMQENYTVKWKASTGADGYLFHWGRDGEEMQFMAPTNQIELTQPRFGGPENTLGKVGKYNCYVHTLKNNKLLISNAANATKVYTIKPELRLADYNEDFVGISEDGTEASIKTNQWVLFDLHAPGVAYARAYAIDSTEDELTGEVKFADVSLDFDYGGFQWIPVNDPAGFEKYIVAEAVYYNNNDEEITVATDPILVHVGWDGEIEGNIVYEIDADANTNNGNTFVDSEGIWEVPLDGRLFVDVQHTLVDENGEPTDEEVNFFGLCILNGDVTDPWTADSHWVDKNDDRYWVVKDGVTYTRVPLTVPRCDVDGEYDVRVFAVKFGSPFRMAETTIPIRVTEREDTSCPVILSMADSFIPGQVLRVYAHYTNPADDDFPNGVEDGELQIRIYEQNNPGHCVFEETQGFEDFWNDGDVIWESGTYVVEARIWQYGEVVREYPELKEINVNVIDEDNPRTARPLVTAVTTIPAGQDLVLNLSAEANDGVEPDWYEYELFRVDWGYAFIDSGSADENNTVTISADRLESGGQYLIRLISRKYGYDSGYTMFKFLVVTPDINDEVLTVTVNGSTNEPQEILSSSNVHVKVDYGNNRPTAIRIMNGEHWDYLWGDYDDRCEFDWGFGDDMVIVYAEATWEDIDFDNIDWNNFNWDEDVNWSGKSNVVRLFVSSPYGEMVAPIFTVENEEMAEGGSGEIPWGDDLIINIEDEGPSVIDEEAEGGKRIVENGWFYCNIFVERYGDNGDTWWDHVNRDYGYNIRSGMNHIPTYNLEDNCQYRLEIGADGEGYSGRSREVEFRIASKQESDEPTKVFTINGDNQDFEVPTYTELEILAYHSDAEWYDLEITREDDESWHENRNDNGIGMFLDHWRSDSEGTFTLKAYANGHLRDRWGNIITDDEGNDSWRDDIGEITVTITADNGSLGDMGVTMNDKAYIGDLLEITFDPLENAQEYSYWIHSDSNNDWLTGDSRHTPGTLSIDTTRLETGVYWVEFDAMATGYNQSHATLHFALLDHDAEDFSAEDDSYYFTISSLEIMTQQGANVVAYVPGADAVNLSTTEGNSLSLQDLEERRGPGLGTWIGRSQETQLTIWLSWRNGGSWTEPIDICTLTITAENDLQTEPHITVNGNGDEDATTVEADEENPNRMTITIDKVENAENYYVELRDMSHADTFHSQGYSASEFEENEAVELVIEDGRIEPGQVYRIYCEAEAEGYNSTRCERTFLLENGAIEGNDLTLTVNGSTEDQEILSSGNVHVKLTYDGERPTAVRIQNGDNREYWWGNEENFERDWGFGDDTVIFYAEATWDDIDFDALEESGWQDFDWDHDVEWSAKSNVIKVTVTSPNGEMTTPHFTVENTYPVWGDDLIVTITDEGPTDSNGQIVADGWYFFNIDEEQYNEWGPWWNRLNNFNYQLRSGVNHIPTYVLHPNCTYRFEVGADAEGYNGRSRWVEFTVTEAEITERPSSFRINGSTEDLEAVTCERLQLAAYHEGSEWYNVAITKEDDENWQDNRGNNESGMLLDEWQADEPGRYILTAYGYGHLRDENGEIYEDENGYDFWEDEIGSIAVDVSADNGPLGELNASMPDIAYVGEPLEVEFEELEHAEEYSYWIHSDEDQEWLAGRSRRTPGTLTIDTGRLQPGVYWVELDAHARGYTQSHLTLHFALLDSNADILSAPDTTPYYMIADDTIETCAGTRIVAYMPGAEAVRLYFRQHGEGYETEEFTYRDGPGAGAWFGRGNSGTYDILMDSLHDGEWSEKTKIGEIEITSNSITLAVPEIHINGTYDEFYVPADEENPNRVTVSFDKAEHATSYNFRIRDVFNGWEHDEWIDATEYDDPIEFTIEDENIVPGRTYEVSCDANATGYETNGGGWGFFLQGSQPTSVELSLEEGEYWTAEPVTVRAYAEGATAIRITMGNEVRWYRGDTVRDDWTVWETSGMFHAYATTDEVAQDDSFYWSEPEVEWTMQSEPCFFEAETLGPIEDMPTLSFTSSVKKGNWFSYTIGEGDARQMDIHIFDEWGNEVEFRRHWAPGTYRIPTAKLNIGQRYWVTLQCVQSKRLWTGMESMPLDVTAPTSDVAFFKASKTTLYTGEPFVPSVYSPNAEHIWITETNWDQNPENQDGVWGDWEGDNGTNDADWEWWFDDAGTQKLTAWAQDKDTHVISKIKTLTFTVNERTALDKAEIQVGDELNANEDNSIVIPLVEDGYYYTLQLHYQGQDENDWLRYRKTVNDAENGALTFDIPAHTLAENQSYWIDCYVDPADQDYAHNGSDSSKNVMTLWYNMKDSRLTVSVSGENVTEENGVISIPINTDFDINVNWQSDPVTTDAPPSAVSVYMGDHADYRFFNDDDGDEDSETFGMSEWQAWPETIYARAYYGELDQYDGWENVPWSELNWSEPSNSVKVNFISGGAAGIPNVDMNRFPYVTMAGDPLVIHVSLGENATGAHGNLDRNLQGGWEDLVYGDWFGMEDIENDEYQGVITIPTDGLESGTYWLYIDNSGPGYEGSRFMERIEIVDPYQSGSKLTLPGSLQVIEEEAFAGTAADTVIIPYGVTTIGSRAFADSNIRSVVIPDSVTSIASDAFDGCDLWIVYGSSDAAEAVARHYDVIYYRTGN